MQLWALLQFAFALTVAIGSLAIILGELHIIERAEERKLWDEMQQKVAQIR